MSKFSILTVLAFIGALVLLNWGFTNSNYTPLIIFAFLYFAVVIYGVIEIQFNLFIESENAGNHQLKQIALSFDDVPNAEITPLLLQKLKQYQIQALFFIIGKRAESQEDLILNIHNEGHILGNHSYSHQNFFPIFSLKNMIQELEATNILIEKKIQHKPRFFRPPFGVTNPRIAKALKQLQMVSVGWSLRTYDTTLSVEKVKARLKRNLKSGDLILLHDGDVKVLEILDFLIPFALQKGLTFVRPDQLIDCNAYEE